MVSLRLLGKLKMELYIDDCESSKTNGLGSSSKLLQVYMTCADIPRADRIHSSEMEKILTVDRHELKSLATNDFDPIYHLFKDRRDDLTDLATSRLKVNHFGEESQDGEKVLVTLSHQCGDNLGIYEILGLSQCFNNNSFRCRFCGWLGKDVDGEDSIQNHDLTPTLIIDTRDERARDLLGASPRRFVFDTVPGVTPFNIAPPDDFHDLPEGTLPEFTVRVLTSIVEKSKDPNQPQYEIGQTKCSAANRIEQKFEEFRFHEGKPSLTWKPGSGFVLKGKACQVRN